MAGSLVIGGNTALSHSGDSGAGTVTVTAEELVLGSSTSVTPSTSSGFYFKDGFATFNLTSSNDYKIKVVDNETTGNGESIGFYRKQSDGTTLSRVGDITTTTSSVALNSTSDYRLKENVTGITDGVEKLKLLKPSRFNFIVDPNTTLDGFLAHEVSEIVPEAITGVKDQVHADGSLNPQMMDKSKLVPLLTAALQEAIEKIEDLTARVQALETT